MITAPRRATSKLAIALLATFSLTLPATAVAAVPAAPAPVAPVVAAAPSAPVSALASVCPGKRIVHKPIKLNGYKIGWLNVYYSRSKGTKCGVVMHAGASWGKTAYTQVQVWNAYSSSFSGGDYRYRTGKASVGGVRGECVSAQGLMDWRGKTRTATVHGLCG
ncbi:hypothetical protein APR04_005437 [Promicromonospora umidemergens]|uniref:Peptidase inhibitor family I36 n=1 Tax=Promicromonospora umidemergens TaxID=629679 RepID=A0ABP8X3C2_9MICO|nr:hypothetical protein [Promicromonospora umidemergens]MCP2286499.1 hypothetical protein [Promicromonospora umidemergens]